MIQNFFVNTIGHQELYAWMHFDVATMNTAASICYLILPAYEDVFTSIKQVFTSSYIPIPENYTYPINNVTNQANSSGSLVNLTGGSGAAAIGQSSA